MTDDATLLHAYATEGSEAAFEELVRRYIGVVYHTALRQTGGDRHRAEDVTQMVFADLARKAATLAKRPLLVAWLHTSARYAAVQAVRAECRRQARERKAVVLDAAEFCPEPEVDWDEVRPMIDDALESLGERDRAAVLLRFFQGCSFAEVGEKLAVTEDAARVRVARALDRVRSSLARRGLTSTSSALAVALAGQAGASVPAGLAAQVAAASIASAAAAAAGTAVSTGGLSFVGVTKIVVGVAVSLAIFSLGVALRQRGERGPVRVAPASEVHGSNSAHPEFQPSPIARGARAPAAPIYEDARIRDGLTRLESVEPAKPAGQEEFVATMLKALGDPAHYVEFRKELVRMIGRTHADVFALMALDDEQGARVKGLLADRFLEVFETTALVGQAGANAWTFKTAFEGSVDDADLKIRELLGEERYARFSSLEETIPFRNQLHEVRDKLAGTPHGLRPEQIERYCQAMLEKWESCPEMDPAMLRLGKLLPFQLAPFDETALSVAKEVLEPEQYAVFSAQKNRRDGAGGKVRSRFPEFPLIFISRTNP